MVRVEALNHAIKGCRRTGSGSSLLGQLARPAHDDIPMRDIVDVMLAVKCSAYSFEAANVRHEHE